LPSISLPSIVCAALLLAPLGVATQESGEPPLETSVKAAFIYKFLGYVEWPSGTFAEADDPLQVVVVDAEAIAEELDRVVAGRSVQGRSIEIHRSAPGEPIAPAHVAFFGNRTEARLPELIRDAPGPVLVVTESEGWRAGGSVINLRVVEGRVRFEISLDAAKERGLGLSSRLLGVALRVYKGAS
jgi:hypothetical protein